ncbi:MAG: septum formation initiator family protein [bacterium]|nr:septum formation initiator family protein [bacterium]
MSKFFWLSKINHSLSRVKLFKIIFGTGYGLRLMLLAAIVVCLVLNVTSVSLAATRGYRLKSLDKRITALKKENQKLNLEVSALSSPKLLQEQARKMGMIAAKDIKYLSPNEGVLVVK